jgi:hypothetical protein
MSLSAVFVVKQEVPLFVETIFLTLRPIFFLYFRIVSTPVFMGLCYMAVNLNPHLFKDKYSRKLTEEHLQAALRLALEEYSGSMPPPIL